MNSLFRVIFSASAVAVAMSLPFLDMSDFSWAENLLITNNGLNMFVSDNTRGDLYRITLAEGGDSYSRTTHIQSKSMSGGEEITAFGGLAQSADGEVIFAGVTFKDDSAAIITTHANATGGEYEVLYRTTYQPNGLQIDLSRDVLYYTDTSSGSLMAVHFGDSSSEKSEVLVESVKFANGCWLDAATDLLYVGSLVSKKVTVFDTSSGEASLVRQYSGMSSLDMQHMLDDITLYSAATGSTADSTSDSDGGSTVLLGADYGGHMLQQFSLDGKQVGEVQVSERVLSEGALQQITSVRWGVGPHFDPESVYVSEGGGMTKKDQSRRVFQVKMK